MAMYFMAGVVTGQENSVTPEEERSIAQGLGAEGSTETKGIESSVPLGLADDFEFLSGRLQRARRVTASPGAVVSVHQHDCRPGVLYMLEGELTEYRNEHRGPVKRVMRDTSFEKGGVIHWWVNESSAKAVALVVDIGPEETS
jgi:quercetin dioxygenase-like cupin family protein